MTSRGMAAINRILFQRHKHLLDAWVAVVVSAGTSLAAGLIVKSLVDNGISGWSSMWPLAALPIATVFLLNMSAMFALAATSCDPKAGNLKPWMFGLFGNERKEPTYAEQMFGWMTPDGRDKLSLIANS